MSIALNSLNAARCHQGEGDPKKVERCDTKSCNTQYKTTISYKRSLDAKRVFRTRNQHRQSKSKVMKKIGLVLILAYGLHSRSPFSALISYEINLNI